MGMTPRVSDLQGRLRRADLAASRARIPSSVVVGDWQLAQDENGDLVAVHLATGETRVVASLG